MTIGAFVSLVGTAVAVKVVSGRWPVAVLVGSLLIATGPTVITPIMHVVPVRDRVAAARRLKVSQRRDRRYPRGGDLRVRHRSQSSPVVVIEAFVARLAVGHVVGIAVGGGTALLLKRWHLSADNALRTPGSWS